ncbi:MAG: GNAT family N-acetyltransferase [Lachnospiraceae bacterium]|nr:GNAT family N-acetyltransferase [Lachnospiraceae bacterium]
MHLRPYNEQTDFIQITKWIQDERTHALWCANFLSHPLYEDEFHNYLFEQNLNFSSRDKSEILCNKNEYDGAYVYADENDHPVGFFIYTVNKQDKSGFLRFIVVDSTLRGKGYGTDMLRELQRFAYEKTDVNSIRLIVFDVNIAARTCYEKAGFTAMESALDTFSYQGEMWGRCMMEHTK